MNPAPTAPAVGDLFLTWNSSRSTFVYRVEDAPKGQTHKHLATAWTFRGVRAMCLPSNPKVSRPAPDMTWKQLHSPNCGAILGQYFPEHDGAAVWISEGYQRKHLGTVAAGVKPAKIKRQISGVGFVAPENWTIKPGCILTASWGYDQTNVDFYKVLTRTGNTITLQECGQHSEETGFMSGNCTPNPDHLTGEVLRKRVHVNGGKDGHVKISHSAYASLWNGRAMHWTSYA